MPELDGVSVLEDVKGDLALQDVPVIMISGVHDSDSVVRCIEIGADDNLPKPFDPVLLRARISAGLTKKRLHELERERLRGVFARCEQFGDEDFVDLMGTFLREAPRLLADLRSGSHEDGRRAAHTLRANATILGAAKFGRMSGELEELAGEDRLEEAGSRVAHTEAEYARLDNALRAVQ
jgi:DNA-binding response OmpR family regulator